MLRQTTPAATSASPDISNFEDRGKRHCREGGEEDDVMANVAAEDGEMAVALGASSRLARRTVAPFLAKHIPQQYAPLGDQSQAEAATAGDQGQSTRFCYRHRPDLKCRRQADEPSMEQLQKELESLPRDDQQGIAHVWSLFSAAPSKHRNLMLRGILAQCCFPQLSFLSAAVRDLIRIDFLTALPPEVSFKILCFLDTTSLCKAAQVSRRWRSLADDDVVWHKMCEQHIDRKCLKCGWGLPLLERRRLRASKRQIQLRATGRGLNMWSPDITPFPESGDVPTLQSSREGSPQPQRRASAGRSAELNGNGKRAATVRDSNGLLAPPGEDGKRPCYGTPDRPDLDDSYFQPRFRPWKDVYKDRFKVGTNWKYGRCSTRIFKGHTNGVMCLQFDDTILATGSYDATIRIWDIESGEELRTLRGHESGIRALQFDDTKLISGSIDRSLKVWNWRTGECISTYSGHNGGVIGLHFDSSILASGSMDKTIKIWNFDDKSTFLLRGHSDWVNAVKVDSASRTVFSASDDCTVRLWDLDSKSCIKVFHGHVGQVQQVLPLPAEFEFEETEAEAAGRDDDGSSIGSSAAEHADPGSNGTAATRPSADGFGDGSKRPLPPRYMLTSALDSTVRLWDVGSGRCLRTFFGHVEGVWALAADTLRFVSGAEDRMVKVWDARSGRCERTFAGHAGAVTCIGLSDSRMCTGSEDCEVRLYSFKPAEGETSSFDEDGGAVNGEASSVAHDV
ncbi:MAG: hypothetical protein M1832_002673 [Thelocarpon impressellum]|nr:MAG: hypothetical protein M1832_002673 [Thelocarpon impressellum]